MLLIARGYEGGCSFIRDWVLIGALAGMLNGFIITNLICRSLMFPLRPRPCGTDLLCFHWCNLQFDIAEGVVGYYSSFITQVTNETTGVTGLHISIIYVIVIGLFLWWFLNTHDRAWDLCHGRNKDVARGRVLISRNHLGCLHYDGRPFRICRDRAKRFEPEL